MTFGEAKSFIAEFLRGDNSNADPQPIHFRMAVMEISAACEPKALTAPYTGNETDVFRILPKREDENGNIIEEYVKTPNIPDDIEDTDEVPLDDLLDLAVVYHICAYLTNKSSDKYLARAKSVIATYVSDTTA